MDAIKKKMQSLKAETENALARYFLFHCYFICGLSKEIFIRLLKVAESTKARVLMQSLEKVLNNCFSQSKVAAPKDDLYCITHFLNLRCSA